MTLPQINCEDDGVWKKWSIEPAGFISNAITEEAAWTVTAADPHAGKGTPLLNRTAVKREMRNGGGVR